MENEQVTVLFVFNGPHNLNADKPNGGEWDLKQFLKKRKALGDVDVNRSNGSSSRSSSGSSSGKGKGGGGGKRSKASSEKQGRTGHPASEENGAAADEMVEGH